MMVLILSLAAVLSLTMAVAFLLARATGNSGWVDTIWSYATGIAGAVAALVPLEGQATHLSRQLLVAVLVMVGPCGSGRISCPARSPVMMTRAMSSFARNGARGPMC